MPERLGRLSESITFCVTVHSPDDLRGLRVDPILIARLQDHVPFGLKAVLVPGPNCLETGDGPPLHDGEHALDLYAFYTVRDVEEWMSGYGCGALCGEGNVYSIYHVFGYPIAIRTGTFIS